MKKNIITSVTRIITDSSFWKSAGSRAVQAALLLGTILTSSLSAQYQEDPVDTALEQKKSDLGSGNKEKIEAFAKGYYLPRWTLAENAVNLHRFRQETASDTASLPSQNKAICQEILVSLFAEMAEREDLAPQVRYNAALAVGMFNEQEPGNNGEGGVPYGAALPKMAEIFNTAEESPKEGKTPDYVILGVLINLERYAAMGTTPDNRKTITDIFFKVLDPSFGKRHNYSPDVTIWMQKIAVDGLALFASPSAGENDTSVLDTFLRLIQDKSIDSTVQAAALAGIGSFKITERGNIDFDLVVSALARSALVINQKEISYIDEENIRSQVDSSRGTPAMTPGGNMNANTNAANDGTESVVARVNSDLESLRSAIDGGTGREGILPLLTEETDEPQKKVLESLIEQIEKTNTYLTYGEWSRAENFDPKKAKLPKQGKNAGPVLMVNVPMVRAFLTEQTDSYQDIVESLSNTEERK